MADVYTDSTALANLVADGYDKFLEYQLRSTPIFRQVVDKHPVNLTNVGPTLTLSIVREFGTLATAPLAESVDVAAMAPPEPDQVTVSVNEYGAAEITTLKLRQLNFAQGGVDPVLAELIGRNMVDSLDELVKTVLNGAAHKIGKNGGTLATDESGTPFAFNSVTASDKLDSQTILAAVTKLRGRSAPARDASGNYVGIVHPDVAADIMTDTGWLSPHQYRDTTAIYNGEIGSYVGARFIQSPRCTEAANSAAVDVYNTYFLGRQALVEATIADAHVVVGPQVDKLRRFNPLGWLYHGGWAVYRQECIEIAQTASSLSGL